MHCLLSPPRSFKRQLYFDKPAIDTQRECSHHSPLMEIGLSHGRWMHTEQHSLSHLWRTGTVICQYLSVSAVFRYPAVMIQCNCRPLRCFRLIFLNLWKRHFDRGIRCLIYQDISLTECLSSIWKVSLYQTHVWIMLFIIIGYRRVGERLLCAVVSQTVQILQ